MAEKTYCTDEELAIETPDFGQLCPKDTYDAYGTDGFITPDRPWALQSAIFGFAVNGVRPRTIINLVKINVFGDEPGESFAVDTVEPAALVLRRIGKPLNEGDPPGDGVNEIAGITFSIRTLYAQIVRATREIDEELGLLDYLSEDTTRVISPADLNVLSDLCVTKVLERRYMAISHGTEVPGAKEVYMEKSNSYKTRYEELRGKILLRLDTGQEIRPRKRKWTRIYRPDTNGAWRRYGT